VSDAPRPRRRIFHGWWIVAASIIGLSTNPGQFAFASLSLFIIPLNEAFGWKRAEVSLASTIFTITLAVSMPVVGRLVDRFGAKRVLIPSVAAFGLLLAAVAACTRLWQLYAVFLLIGSLGAGANALPFMRIISAWFDRRRGLAMGIAMAGGGLGYAYVPPLVQYMIDGYGWQAGYFALAAIVLLLSVPSIWLFVRETPRELGLAPDGDAAIDTGSTAGPTTPVAGLDRREALRSRAFWLLTFVFFTLSFSLYGLLQHLVPMLRDRGMAGSAAALAASSMGMTIVFARVAIGYLVDRFFAPHVALACFSVSALGVAMLAAGAVGAPAYVAAVLVGISLGAEIDLLAFMTSRYFGMRCFGEVYGLLFASFLAGASIGPVAYGATYDGSGSYVSVLLASCVLIAAACAVTARLPRYPKLDEDRIRKAVEA
jgi:MFS family permease